MGRSRGSLIRPLVLHRARAGILTVVRTVYAIYWLVIAGGVAAYMLTGLMG